MRAEAGDASQTDDEYLGDLAAAVGLESVTIEDSDESGYGQGDTPDE